MNLLDDPISIFAIPEVVTVTTQETMGYALLQMINHRFKRLPVVDDKQKLVGIITSSDILNALDNVNSISFLQHKVQQHMVNNVVFCGENATLLSVIKTMNGKDVSCVPVVDRKRRLKGIFTNKDLLLLHQLWRDIPDILLTQEHDMISSITREMKIKTKSTIKEAVNNLTRTKSKILIIEDDQGDNVGMISINRIMRSLATQLITEKMSIEYLNTDVINTVVQEPILYQCLPIKLEKIRNFMNARGLEVVPLCINENDIEYIIAERDLKGYLAKTV